MRPDPGLHSTPFSQLDAKSEVIKVKIIEPNEHGLSEMGRPASIGILPRRRRPPRGSPAISVNGVEDGGELCGCTDHCHVTGVEIDDVRPEQRNGSLLEFLDVTLVPGEVHVRPGYLALVAA